MEDHAAVLCARFNLAQNAMPLKAILIGLALCWSAQAHAQSCGQLYNAIKRAAMYCGFDCDQQTLEPVQQAYERQCIIAMIPMSIFPDDPRPDRPSTPVVLDRVTAFTPVCAEITVTPGATCTATK